MTKEKIIQEGDVIKVTLAFPGSAEGVIKSTLTMDCEVKFSDDEIEGLLLTPVGDTTSVPEKQYCDVYQEECARTDLEVYGKMDEFNMGENREEAVLKPNSFENRAVNIARLVHHAFGILTEGGEIADNLKKHLAYNADLDKENLKAELGDLCWYMSRMMTELGTSWNAVMLNNINKLKFRFPDKFDETRAMNRDLDTEHEKFGG